MANPPFNVKSVKESTVKGDPRFYEYGLPKNKGKKDDKISDANYLWVSLFATSLNKTGRAGFVMPNSASDARGSEYDIRKNIVDSGIVDCMVSMPSNMFFTVTLPATLWFFDKQKVNTDRKDKILFLDARNVYNQIDRAHREWTEEQQQNLATIVRLYRGETDRYLALMNSYILNADEAINDVTPLKEELEKKISAISNSLKVYVEETKDEKRTPAKTKALKEGNFFDEINSYSTTTPNVNEDKAIALKQALAKTPLENDAQIKAKEFIGWNVKQHNLDLEALKKDVDKLLELWDLANKNAKLKTDKVWSKNGLGKGDKELEIELNNYSSALEQLQYWNDNIHWMQKRFPEAKYKDVVGLCKMADRSEYVEEQDYSLNAGRYVGVEIEDDNLTSKEFKRVLSKKAEVFNQYSKKAIELENLININLKELLV